MADFLVARNPEADSALPYLIRLPLGDGIVLKTRETWPRTSKVYCHRTGGWPDQPEILERVPVRSCVRRGAAIDLVLDRGRENRSQLVVTMARGREMIFWQSARTAKQARPGVRTPTARAQGLADLTIVVDTHERYAWQFTGEQVTTVKRALPAGDYAVERDGRLVAVVERKSLEDLVSGLTTGKIRFQLTELAAQPRAAIVVEDRYSRVFSLTHVRPALVADQLAECQAGYPAVPIVFAETRTLAQQWAYRFLAACLDAELDAESADAAVSGLVVPPFASEARPVRGGRLTAAAGESSPAAIRAWAKAQGIGVAAKGRLPADVAAAYQAAHAPASAGTVE